MKIVCTFAPPTDGGDIAQQVVLTVFDAFVDGKSLVVGLCVGEVRGQSLEDVRASVIGERVLRRLVEYHNFRYPEGPLILAGVASISSATQRVRKVLEQAPDRCALALLCADDKVYDKAFEALNVDYQSLAGKTQ